VRVSRVCVFGKEVIEVEFVIQVPREVVRWLENGEAHHAVRREAGRQDIKILLPSTMIPDDGRCVTARERYGLLPDEVAIVTENGAAAEVVAGLCRTWASAGEHPIERAREFIGRLPVLVMLEGEP
jgi:hypothetical protein